jgi:hypothetical protein
MFRVTWSALGCMYLAGRYSKFKTFLTPVWLMGGVRLIQTQCELLTLGSAIVPCLVREPPGTLQLLLARRYVSTLFGPERDGPENPPRSGISNINYIPAVT